MAEANSYEWEGRHAGKDELRLHVWAQLQQQGAALGDPLGHIPNFVGAEQAATRLQALPIWQRAHVVKCNPDSPQIPVRLQAMRDGKTLYMAVPRLVDERCFVELRASSLAARGIDLAAAASWQGALEHGQLVEFAAMQPIDLVVTGCVAVTRDGGRTGKGAGFADIELGMLRQLGLLRPGTPIITTVHQLQVVEGASLPMQPHDSPLDWIITPDEVIETRTPFAQPSGIDWQAVLPEQLEAIPALRRLAAHNSRR